MASPRNSNKQADATTDTVSSIQEEPAYRDFSCRYFQTIRSGNIQLPACLHPKKVADGAAWLPNPNCDNCALGAP